MHKDERDLLEVLKFELAFIEKGGYGRSPRAPWRPRFIFEDSPTCMNYDSKEDPAPCVECVLMQLVPSDCRAEKIPCRHIPLDAAGDTLDALYRYDDDREIVGKVETWLRQTIQQLEEARKVARSEKHKPPAQADTPIIGTPLLQALHPKCANPACPTAFHWLGGGKFFRFRPDQPSVNPAAASFGVHNVLHYWLCERCSCIFTLVFVEGSGVTLKVLHPELPASDVQKMLMAS